MDAHLHPLLKEAQTATGRDVDSPVAPASSGLAVAYQALDRRRGVVALKMIPRRTA